MSVFFGFQHILMKFSNIKEFLCNLRSENYIFLLKVKERNSVHLNHSEMKYFGLVFWYLCFFKLLKTT